jgi:hypothetical protein
VVGAAVAVLGAKGGKGRSPVTAGLLLGNGGNAGSVGVVFGAIAGALSLFSPDKGGSGALLWLAITAGFSTEAESVRPLSEGNPGGVAGFSTGNGGNAGGVFLVTGKGGNAVGVAARADRFDKGGNVLLLGEGGSGMEGAGSGGVISLGDRAVTGAAGVGRLGKSLCLGKGGNASGALAGCAGIAGTSGALGNAGGVAPMGGGITGGTAAGVGSFSIAIKSGGTVKSFFALVGGVGNAALFSDVGNTGGVIATGLPGIGIAAAF